VDATGIYSSPDCSLEVASAWCFLFSTVLSPLLSAAFTLFFATTFCFPLSSHATISSCQRAVRDAVYKHFVLTLRQVVQAICFPVVRQTIMPFNLQVSHIAVGCSSIDLQKISKGRVAVMTMVASQQRAQHNKTQPKRLRKCW
jgi:phosphate/sulfate permease